MRGSFNYRLYAGRTINRWGLGMVACLLKGAGQGAGPRRRFRPFGPLSCLTLCLAAGAMVALSAPVAASPTFDEAVRKEAFRVLTQTIQRILSRRARVGVLGLMAEGDSAAKFPEFQVASMGRGLEVAQGMAGKGGAMDVAAWFNFTSGNVDTDGGNIDSDIDTHIVLGGIDISFLDRYVVGVSVGGQKADTTSHFLLTSGAAARADTNSANATIALYGAGILTDNFFIDANLGFANSDTEFNQVQFGVGLKLRRTPGFGRGIFGRQPQLHPQL